MATKATVYKAILNIADMDRHYYHLHNLTLAQHPSETDLRLMARLVAFGFNADESLVFGAGISDDDEADLWKKSLTGEIELWIDLGQPDEKRIRKACGRAKKVLIYAYQERSATEWWKQAEKSLQRFTNLSIAFLKVEGDLETLTKRTMDLQCNISDGELTLMDAANSVVIRRDVWKA